jgi:TPR repeat protein
MPFDPAEAAWLLDKAAAGGSARALCMIGAMFQRGMGVERDAGEASRWFLAAAEAGDGNAQFEIGRAYLEGDGLAINADEAARWLQAAVESGIGEAHALLERAKMRLSQAAPGATATADELATCESKGESACGIVHSLHTPHKGAEMEGAPA